jgi:hypothetical protein
MADGDRGSPLNSNMIFRGLVVTMFGIIITLVGYVAAGMDSRVGELSHRLDLQAQRLNDYGERLVRLETEFMDRAR